MAEDIAICLKCRQIGIKRDNGNEGKIQIIFTITCERAIQSNMMDRFTDSQVFCYVRMYAEYSTRCAEQKLEDIYSYMTAAFPGCQPIMQIELETEKQNSYINESIKSLIYDAHNLGIQ